MMSSDVNVPTSSHQVLYKNNSHSTDALHQKHRETTIELRKQTRDDGFTRTRRLLELAREQQPLELSSRSIFDESLLNDLNSTNEERELVALLNYSHLFTSHERVDYFHDAGLTTVVVEIFMRVEAYTQLESACIVVLSKLSNDFSRISCFAKSGFVAKLVNSLNSTDSDTVDHAVFLLEEIVRLDSDTRSLCDSLQIVPTSIDLYFRFDRLDLRRQILAMFNNYFEYETQIHEISKQLLDFFTFILMNEADEILLNDIFEILTKIVHFSEGHAQLFVENDFLSTSSQYLNSDVSQACLNFIKSIAEYGKRFVQILSDLGYFEQTWSIANCQQQVSRKRGEAYSLIATFVANGYVNLKPECPAQLMLGLISSIGDSKFEIRKQSLLVLKQLLLNCTSRDFFTLCVNADLLGALCDLLTVMHVDTVVNSIFCLDKIMDWTVLNGVDSDALDILEVNNASDKFEFLTSSNCYEVFKAADAFIEKYLDKTADEELDLRCNA